MFTKYVILTVITAFLLLMLGFWSGPWVLVYIVHILNQLGLCICFVEAETTYEFSALVGALLATCAPTATVMLWAFSRKQSGWPRAYGFFLFLLPTVISAAAGIGFGLLSLKGHLGSVEYDISVWYALAYLLWWAFGTLLGGCGLITIILFFISPRRKRTCNV